VAPNPDQIGLISKDEASIIIDLDLKHVIPAQTEEQDKIFRGREEGRTRGDG
jgi:hypothetical protein